MSMNTVKSILIAGMCVGSLCMTANAADSSSHRPSTGSTQSSVLIAAANMNESNAKQAKEDFQLKKKRLENERDAALTQCANKAGKAQTDCRKQANANFNSRVKQE